MSCNPVIFNQVARADLDCLKTGLVKAGIVVPPGDAGIIDGQFQGHHITAEVFYDEPRQTLTVTVTHKPFLASCGMVTGKIHDAIHACQKAPLPAPPLPVPLPEPLPEPTPTPPVPEPTPAPGPVEPITLEFERGIKAERDRNVGIIQRALAAVGADITEFAKQQFDEALKEIQQ